MSGPADPAWSHPPPPQPSAAPGPGTGASRTRPVLLVVVLVAVGGLPLGLLWALLAPEVPVRVTGRGATYVEGAPAEPFAADAWFAALSGLFGVVAAAAVWWGARMLRGVPGLLAVTVGALLAAGLAWQTGRRVGLSGYESERAAAEVGEVLTRPADLGTAQLSWLPPWVGGVLLVPALTAALAYTLFAAASRGTELAPEGRPARQPAVSAGAPGS